MNLKVISALSGAVLGVLGTAATAAGDDAAAVEERIKPIGTVVVANPAPAAQSEGMSGMSGMAGTEGMSGMSGMAGTEGMSGMSGMAGTEGMSGMSGMAGMEGMSGMSVAPAGGGDAQALAQTSGCLACHQVDTKVVGPAFKEVAAKYAGDAAARDMLIGKVKNGGAGAWGQVPMPPNAHVGDDNIATLVDWVLAL